MITAIFPAAGQSRRMCSTVNKNFMTLDGVPILIRTLRIFSLAAVDEFIVAASSDELEQVKNLIGAEKNLKPCRVVEGGSERQYSIANALKVLPESTELVLVHDAARPLVSLETIDAVIDSARSFGGAIAAVPAKNTIKVVDADGFVESTPSRASLVEVQTPQGFRREILLEAYARAARDGFLGTDDASLVERLGVRVKVVASDYRNIKITTPEDLRIAAALMGGAGDDADRQRL